ncbi:acyltransferase family protein [Halomonas sp. A29]|uniref:acyltransferase family protein n=1 Tax=Halomonas sp. A29 TaxID=3102786 RepID=UPI00398B798E
MKLGLTRMSLANWRYYPMAKSYSRDYRLDIQGLRAVAVSLVVIYHIWPHYLTGGFVGVDVFFVISGYLITCHLRQEIERKGTLSLRDFYARRIRRLLPAASLVLVVTVLASFFIAPKFKLLAIAYDTMASTLYVQNWRLLLLSVDYLGSEESAGPLQHFWSLAIEEQYYIVWPLLLLGLTSIVVNTSFRIAAAWLVSCVMGLSLLASVVISRSDQSVAYFATHTRIWELALGSMLAFFQWNLSNRTIKSSLGWLGLAMIFLSAFTFNSETVFPGYAALLPTLGTAILIWVGGNGLAHEQGLSLKPVTFVGDLSYSLYLWHWPIIIFAGYLGLENVGVVQGLGIMLVSVVLAWCTKVFVEDGFRITKQEANYKLSIKHWLTTQPFGLASTCMMLSLTVSAGVYFWVLNQGSVRAVASIPGARALIVDSAQMPLWQPGEPISPSPELARGDMPTSYSNGCHQGIHDTEPKGCEIGASEGDKLVIVAGDSHAANWIPAFEVLGQEQSWRVISYTKSGCSLTLLDMQVRGRRYDECTKWSSNVLDEITRMGPDLVVLGRSAGGRVYESESRQSSDEDVVSMLSAVFSRIRKSGAEVVLIRDTPRMPFDPLLCFEDSSKCSAERDEAMKRYDPLIDAASLDGETSVIDMTDGLCRDDLCHVVEGNVIVWRDQHHLTETYSRTLAPLLGQKLARVTGWGLENN